MFRYFPFSDIMFICFDCIKLQRIIEFKIIFAVLYEIIFRCSVFFSQTQCCIPITILSLYLWQMFWWALLFSTNRSLLLGLAILWCRIATFPSYSNWKKMTFYTSNHLPINTGKSDNGGLAKSIILKIVLIEYHKFYPKVGNG